jgi:hypothetical protein
LLCRRCYVKPSSYSVGGKRKALLKDPPTAVEKLQTRLERRSESPFSRALSSLPVCPSSSPARHRSPRLCQTSPARSSISSCSEVVRPLADEIKRNRIVVVSSVCRRSTKRTSVLRSRRPRQEPTRTTHRGRACPCARYCRVNPDCLDEGRDHHSHGRATPARNLTPRTPLRTKNHRLPAIFLRWHVNTVRRMPPNGSVVVRRAPTGMTSFHTLDMRPNRPPSNPVPSP